MTFDLITNKASNVASKTQVKAIHDNRRQQYIEKVVPMCLSYLEAGYEGKQHKDMHMIESVSLLLDKTLSLYMHLFVE